MKQARGNCPDERRDVATHSITHEGVKWHNPMNAQQTQPMLPTIPPTCAGNRSINVREYLDICSTNECGQLLLQRVQATAPPTRAGNCSTNVHRQMLRQRARATAPPTCVGIWTSAPPTCAGNVSVNVRGQLLRQRVRAGGDHVRR